jgi:allantoinase
VVDAGRIAAVDDHDEAHADHVLDVGDLVVMPGLIDTHVHVNEPGRTEWEGFASATRAAAAGGITTLLDMPLNSIPATTTVGALAAKRRSALESSVINVEFIGGVVPGNAAEIEPLAKAGVRAFKCFLSPSGVEEFLNVTEADLREAFPALARTGLPLMVHAEDPACLLAPSGDPRDYACYVASRPVAAEHAAIELLVRLVEWCETPVHIVHLSSATSLPIIRAARARGLPITVETCPHYLTFAAEEIANGATEFKCAPPIRDSAERDGLWRGLLDGEIDLVASDHSPCPPWMKETSGDFFAAWGGIASLQLSLAAVWTGAARRGSSLGQIARWMSEAPARLARLYPRKGVLAVGSDADIMVWNPDETFVVDRDVLLHRHRVTPYAGRTLTGVVHATFVAGRCVFSSLPAPMRDLE